MDISIVIPVYNVEAYLRECLDSVIQQNYSSMEVVCVNDGSTDGSLKILKDYEKKYSFIKVFTKENGGLSSARNYGIKKAKGKYLYFLDSDDMLADEHCVAFMVQNMSKYSLDILYFDGKSFFESNEMVHENSNYVTAYQRLKSYGNYDEGMQLFEEMIREGDYYPSVCLQCVSKKFLYSVGIQFAEGLNYEDNLFTFQTIIRAKKVMHQKRIILLRRIRENSIMQSTFSFQGFYNLVTIMRLIVQECYLLTSKKQQSVAISTLINMFRNYIVKMYNKLDDSDKKRIQELPSFEQYLIKSFFIPNIKKTEDNYFFPYHLFHKGDKVLIYGAGNIGKKFYYKALGEDFVEIVGIVDVRACDMVQEEIPVLPITMIKQMAYDYILISVENQEIAKSIQVNLLQMGIERARIKWDGNIYYKNNYIKKSYQFNKFIKRNIEAEGIRFYLFMLPEHGNMGDYAIGYAEQKFFADYFPEFKLICVTTEEWIELKEFFLNTVRENDVIFISGGGYFGDLWKSGSIAKSIIESFVKNVKIYLPNNLTYRDSDWKNNKCVSKDLCWLAKQSNTHIFFRDRKSYEYANSIIENCMYSPDMAMYLHFPRKVSLEEKRVLLCFRSDAEKVFSGADEVREIIAEKGIIYDEMDIHFMKRVTQEQGKRYLMDVIQKVQSYSLVITDRLHGMILSAISEVPCIAFDNSTHKVFGVSEWLENIETVRVLEANELVILPQLIEDLTLTTTNGYQIDYNNFTRMADYIRSVLPCNK